VYSDIPRNVYFKLNNGPTINLPILQPVLHPSNQQPTPRIHPIPASIRKQKKLINKLHLRTLESISFQAVSKSFLLGKEVYSRVLSNKGEGVSRNPTYQIKRKKRRECSLSSAGEILCCSSINSYDIRNCN
jgi:hypothetical protein